MYTVFILATGKDNEIKSNLPVVLHNISFKPLINWVIDATDDAKKQVVVGDDLQKIESVLRNNVSYANDEKSLLQHLENIYGDILIISGNVSLITKNTINLAYEFHTKSDNVITIINSDIYFLNMKELHSYTGFLSKHYFENALELLKNEGKKIGNFVVDDNNEIISINNRIQLALAEEIMRKRIAILHMQNGVTFISPENAYIGGDVTIGYDTIIMPNTIIQGKTSIGIGCEIGPNSRIVDSHINDYTDVNNSVVLKSVIGQNTHIGPFAYIRPNSKICDNVKVGDFVEVKNSVIDNGTKISHLTYVGDADVGKNVNFGCGTVLVNYDGKNKYRSKIDDNAFIGCNTNLVSPVIINKGAFIAAGSTITHDVPDNCLAIARSRQVVKTDWKKK